MRPPPLSRSDFLRPLLLGALASPLVPPPASVAAAAARPVITDKVYLDLRIIKRYDVEVLEDSAVRGRLTLGLYGKEAPLGVARYLEFIDGTPGQYARSGGGPAYSGATFDRVRPGELLEGGRIAGLKQTEFAGALEWEYMSRLLPQLRPVLEANDLTHTSRGLLTRERFNAGGPEFGLTLGAAPSLDNSHEIIGEVVDGLELLVTIEGMPFITGKSIDPPGSAKATVFSAQKALFSSISKGVGDSRAEDRTGKLLRRVEIVACGRL